ncbi:MAG UNVERIFIED_CONTAM: type IV secretory system conjugative DNA transfer family protein [Rickettsiaceae bacterium]
MHILGIGALAWLIGALMALATNQMALITLDLDPILVTQKWSIWLYNSWNILSWSAYNSIKTKLVLCLVVPIIVSIWIYIRLWDKIAEWEPIPPREKVFGSAAWATQSDIKKAGLRSKQGMLLGVDRGGYFIAEGFQHALLFAPTGSGKGVGFVLPNLLFWNDSVVVHDIKLENHMITSGWRAKQGQQVFVWEPANPDGITHCYNPIDWISNKPGQMVDDVQKISSLILPKQEFWENEARSLFVGVMLYLISDVNKAKSFGEAVRALRSDDVVYNFAVALDTLGGVMHPVGYMNLAAFLQKADQERSGVVSTLNSGLELWANPLIDAATASSDFNVLEFKKKKTTVYVGLTPDNINRLQKLMQVFYQQSTEFLSRKMPNLKEEPFGVMFLMDEFPTLGKMEQFKSGIAYFRGYRVRLFLIIQDTQQLKGTYEEAGMNSFLSNSTYRITFAANNYETANLISQLCGNKTVEQTSKSKPQFFDLNPATRTMNVSEVQRALLLPQEVIQLPRDEQIILIESQPPIKSKKIFYYQDKFFTSRLLPPTFVPTQKPYDPRDHKVDDEDEKKDDVENNSNMEELASEVSLEDSTNETAPENASDEFVETDTDSDSSELIEEDEEEWVEEELEEESIAENPVEAEPEDKPKKAKKDAKPKKSPKD